MSEAELSKLAAELCREVCVGRHNLSQNLRHEQLCLICKKQIRDSVGGVVR